MKEMLYEVRYLKSSDDMILALAGQFKHLSPINLQKRCGLYMFTVTKLHLKFNLLEKLSLNCPVFNFGQWHVIDKK